MAQRSNRNLAIEARGYRAVDAGLADIAERLATLEHSRSLLAAD